MTLELKRYKPVQDYEFVVGCSSGKMVESPEGDYVRFGDIELILSLLYRVIVAHHMRAHASLNAPGFEDCPIGFCAEFKELRNNDA